MIGRVMGGELERSGAGGVLSPMIVLEEAIDVCGQVAEEVVKGIGCQIN
jgi:hypothetical protein